MLKPVAPSQPSTIPVTLSVGEQQDLMIKAGNAAQRNRSRRSTMPVGIGHASTAPGQALPMDTRSVSNPLPQRSSSLPAPGIDADVLSARTVTAKRIVSAKPRLTTLQELRQKSSSPGE